MEARKFRDSVIQALTRRVWEHGSTEGMETRKFRVFVFFCDSVIQTLARRAREHGSTEGMESRKFRVSVPSVIPCSRIPFLSPLAVLIHQALHLDLFATKVDQ